MNAGFIVSGWGPDELVPDPDARVALGRLADGDETLFRVSTRHPDDPSVWPATIRPVDRPRLSRTVAVLGRDGAAAMRALVDELQASVVDRQDVDEPRVNHAAAAEGVRRLARYGRESGALRMVGGDDG